jgi:hypothetical protein
MRTMSFKQRARIRILQTYRKTEKYKRDYQPRSNIVKDENGDLPADSYKFLNRRKSYFSHLRKNYFSHLLNVRELRQLSPFEAESVVAKFKTYKLPDTGQILAGLIQALGETLRSEIHKLIIFLE